MLQKKSGAAIALAMGLLFSGGGVVLAASFTPGNLAVVRVGSGTGTLVNTGNDVFIDEYSITGSLVQSIAIPAATTTVSGFALSGVATSDGMLNLSTDGRYLTLGGYSLKGATSIASSDSAINNRVIARLDLTGTVDTSTRITDAGTGNMRSVASTNGTDLWIATSNAGVRYTTFGSTGTSTQLTTTPTNFRHLELVNGQLLASANSGTTRLGSFGAGAPTTSGQAFANIPGTDIGALTSPYGFFFADLDAAVAGNDTLYVADDSANQIRKFSLVGGNWVSTGNSAAAGVRGLTGSVNGGVVSLFATTGASGATGGGSLYALTDGTGYNQNLAATANVIASLAAGSNQAFRGIDFTPFAGSVVVPEPSTIALVGLGIVGLTLRRRKKG